jgi:hypothetical protein
MKKKWLLFPILIVVLIFTLLPVNFLSANPGNLVKDGDFSAGNDNSYWDIYGNVTFPDDEVLICPDDDSYIYKYIST